MTTIGGCVKGLREQSGLNQTQLAEFLGVDQSLISKCEKGERQFTVEVLEKICNLFGVNIDRVINCDPENSKTKLKFAFRASIIEPADLLVISELNRIAMDIKELEELLEN